MELAITDSRSGVVTTIAEVQVPKSPFNRKQRRVLASLIRRRKVHALPSNLFSNVQKFVIVNALATAPKERHA